MIARKFDIPDPNFGQVAGRHANVTDPALRVALLRDDEMENRGGHADDRLTCFTCQTWATDPHLASPKHAKAVGW